MIPYYIQKWGEAADSNNNRKSALCPVCGREELISKDNELGKCSICVQISDKSDISGEDIKKLREKIGISLKSLCNDLNIDKSLFLKIERGERPVNSTLTEWYRSNTKEAISPDAQNSPLNPDTDKDISTYQLPLFCPPEIQC